MKKDDVIEWARGFRERFERLEADMAMLKERENTIEIQGAEGGAIVGFPEEGNRIYKFEDTEGEIDLAGLQELLYSISDFLAPLSRYSPQRIEVRIVHGDKYECQNKKCEICKGERGRRL